MNLRNPFLLTLALSLTGCATTVTPVATGGSRADGIVEMSYEYGAFVVPQVDTVAAMRTARRRCETWGYDDAEAFTGLSKCVQGGSSGCNLYRVTTEYQCLNTGKSSVARQTTTKNFRDEIRQIQESMACSDGARIVSQTAESERWELVCGDGESLEVRCFEDDCYIR